MQNRYQVDRQNRSQVVIDRQNKEIEFLTENYIGMVEDHERLVGHCVANHFIIKMLCQLVNLHASGNQEAASELAGVVSSHLHKLVEICPKAVVDAINKAEGVGADSLGH